MIHVRKVWGDSKILTIDLVAIFLVKYEEMKLFSRRQTFLTALSILLILVLYAFLYKVYMPRVNAFGCFDDCNNFMGGYFLLHGKKLFSEIFFNHAPGMAYISAAIQSLTHPQNLYDLVLKHRQFVFFFGLIMNILLLLRFGYSYIAFPFLYETTKFYIFGDRFLAEGIVIYPLIYLTGIVWKKIHKHNMYLFDFIFVGLAGWLVVWTREPYIPLTLFLLAIFLWGKGEWKRKNISLAIFLILSVITLFYHNISELIFNVFTTNALVNIPLENKSSNILGTGLLTVFFYPLTILFWGQSTYFRLIELLVDIPFLTLFVIVLLKKQWKMLLYIFVLLGLANLRYTPAGKEYYDAFHQVVWYGLFLFSLTLLYTLLPKLWMKIISGLLLIVFVTYIFLSPQSFWHEKAQPYQEFITNYGKVLQVGEIVHTLSQPKDTLFIDGFDDMIYWTSKRYSDYPYSWYTSLMPSFEKYTKVRSKMLATNSPDFYYGSCLADTNTNRTLTLSQRILYVRLVESGKPSCLWVKKTKISSISQAQWDEAAKGYYTLPL